MFAKDLDENTMNSEIFSGTTIVDFWAEWCGPCKALAPILDDLGQKYQDKIKVGKVDISEQLELAKQYRVSSIPCLVVFKDGKEVDRVIGFRGKDFVESLFVKHS